MSIGRGDDAVGIAITGITQMNRTTDDIGFTHDRVRTLEHCQIVDNVGFPGEHMQNIGAEFNIGSVVEPNLSAFNEKLAAGVHKTAHVILE